MIRPHRLPAPMLLLIAAALTTCAPLAKVPGPAPAAAPTAQGPAARAPLLDGVGRVHMPITTPSAPAQVYFDQGMALLYGYWWFEARRSFEAAVALDSTCAMCHWGLYQSLSEGSARARAALENAKRFAPRTSAREQLFIRADALYDSLDTHAAAEEAFIANCQGDKDVTSAHGSCLPQEM